MTLEASSVAVLEAARSGDLDALASALAARQDALSRGELPTPGVHAAGELTLSLLRDLIRETGLESARLSQLERSLRSAESPFYVDLAG